MSDPLEQAIDAADRAVVLVEHRQQIAAAQGLARGKAAFTGDFIAIQKALGSAGQRVRSGSRAR